MTFIAEGILDTTATAPTLLGGRSRESGEVKFPFLSGEQANGFDPVALKREGKLWAFTVQRFPPGKPFIGVTDRSRFEPYGVGYVELEEEVIVETRIVTDNVKSLKMGMSMTLVLETLERGDGEGFITTYAFRPSEEISA